MSLSRRRVAKVWSPSAVALACNMANNWRVSMPNAWSSSSLILQALAIQRDRELVLVNSSSICSSRDKGSVMLMALVGSADRRRLISALPTIARERITVVACAKCGRIEYLIAVYALPPRTLRSMIAFNWQKPVKRRLICKPIVVEIETTRHQINPLSSNHAQ